MKTITVKGIGQVSAPVDTVELSFHVSEKNKDYEKALNGASAKVDALEQALVRAGFPAEDFQSAGFHVHMEYESVRDKNGEYRNAFAGYVCSYDQRLRFGFDTKRLGEALDAAAESKALPELNVSFTVREPDRLQEELLEKELRSTSQRVNLFEKVKIPEAIENIRVIEVYLGDQQTAAVVRGKIAKKKLTEAAK